MLTQMSGIVMAAAEQEEKAPLFMPFWMFGVGMFCIFLVLMLITASFSNLGNRHDPIDEAPDPHRQHSDNHDHGEAAEAASHH